MTDYNKCYIEQYFLDSYDFPSEDELRKKTEEEKIEMLTKRIKLLNKIIKRHDEDIVFLFKKIFKIIKNYFFGKKVDNKRYTYVCCGLGDIRKNETIHNKEIT